VVVRGNRLAAGAGRARATAFDRLG
jgi:hypothetical protein